MISPKTILQKTIRLLKDETGPTAVEYAFIIALIIVVAITGITVFGNATGDSFQDSSDKIDTAFSS